MKPGISDVNESATPFGTEFGILIDQPFYAETVDLNCQGAHDETCENAGCTDARKTGATDRVAGENGIFVSVKIVQSRFSKQAAER